MIKLLEERAKKGVVIRVIGSAKKLGADIEVRKPGMRLHVRAIIRDGTRAFVGSQSLRNDELENRREVGLLINNPSVTRKLMQVFESDWEECGGKKEAREEERAEAAKKGSANAKGDRGASDAEGERQGRAAEGVGRSRASSSSQCLKCL